MKYGNEVCDLYKKIPRELLNKLFESSKCSAELDFTFLGFEEPYQKVLELVPKDMVIIDLGCSYACQSWYFKEHERYIGVDAFTTGNSVLHTENSEFYFETIQTFIKKTLPALNLDVNHVFAVCSAVPDKEARQMVRDTFPHYLDWYPGEEINIQISVDRNALGESELDEAEEEKEV